MSWFYFTGAVLWTTIPAFQFGYHTSALNQLQATMSCYRGTPAPGILSLPSCIPMSDTQFGILTSAFTVGGLLGSLVGGSLSDRLGRKGASIVSSTLTVLGALSMAASWIYPLLVAGRLVVGVASGIALCVVPVMLSELASPKIKGAMGTLNQVAVVTGVLVTQSVGLVLAKDTLWRYVLVLAAGISALQVLFSPFIYDTPTWLEDKGKDEQAKRAAELLWGDADPTIGDEEVSEPEQQPLLQGESEEAPEADVGHRQPVSFKELFTSPELRTPLLVTMLCFLAQQGSGINAVMFYSTNILGGVMPELSGYISIIIAVINAVMTFPPVFLIDRVGKRIILLWSIIGTTAFAILVAVGLDIGHPVLSAVGIVGFVATFAAGLGPIPFVVTAQIAPYYAVSTLSSAALSVQWVLNFLVAVGFLPLRRLLSFGTGLDGNVFVVFICVLVFCGVSLSRVYQESQRVSTVL